MYETIRYIIDIFKLPNAKCEVTRTELDLIHYLSVILDKVTLIDNEHTVIIHVDKEESSRHRRLLTFLFTLPP